MALDTGKIRDFVQKTWDQSIVPTLHEYVKIPAKSPMFDAQWREHGHIDRAVELLRGWATERPIEGLRSEVVRLGGGTPTRHSRCSRGSAAITDSSTRRPRSKGPRLRAPSAHPVARNSRNRPADPCSPAARRRATAHTGQHPHRPPT